MHLLNIGQLYDLHGARIPTLESEKVNILKYTMCYLALVLYTSFSVSLF